MRDNGMYVQERILVRPRVHQMIRDGAAHPLCIVTAGTGYGKSRTVLSFLQREEVRYIWLQLTEMDNYIPRFWEITCHAVASVNETLAGQMRNMGFPNTPELLYKCLKLLEQALVGRPDIYIILDDFHNIEEPAIVRLVEACADAGIKQLHIFLLSRRPVPMDYFSLYNNGRLHRLTEEDLRFTYEEVELYYKLLEFSFPAKVVTNIYDSTEGWPLALYLIGLHKFGGKGHKKDPVTFTMPFLNSLFEVEVFSAYPEEIQDLFVRLSLLEAVPKEAVKAIAGDGFAQVDEALHGNMFISYNPSVDNQFVFHRLFRRFLKPRRDALPSAERKKVYSLVADWYYRQKRYSEALDFYEKSGDYEGQWAVMQNYAKQDYMAVISARCIVLAERFPPEFVAENLMVVIHKGYMYLNLGRIEESARTFEAVLESMRGDESEAARRLAGEAWLGLAPVRIYQHNWEFITCFENAARLLPDGSEYMGINNHYLGNGNVLTLFSCEEGELDLMASKMAYIWPIASEVMNGCGSGMEHLAIAEAAFYRRRFEDALQYAHKGLFTAVAHRQRDIVCASYYLLVRIYFAKGDFAHIMQYLGELETYMAEMEYTHAWGVDGLIKAWLYQRMGDFGRIPEWVYGEPLDPENINIVTVSREKVVETDCLMRKGEYGLVLDRVDVLLEIYEEQSAVFMLIKTLLQKAICLLYTDEVEKAVATFLTACRTAMPNDIRMTIVEEGAEAVKLANLLEAREDVDQPLLAWIEQVKKEAGDYFACEQNIRNAYAQQQKEQLA